MERWKGQSLGGACLRLAAAICAGAVAASCATPPRLEVGQPAPVCCLERETLPKPVVAIIEPAAPVIGHVVDAIRWRPGFLADRVEAKADILSRLRPLDIVAISSKGRMSGQSIPGLFEHVAIYVGDEAEQRRMGIFDADPVAGKAEAIKAGKTFVEAEIVGVHLVSPDELLDTDRVAVMRPRFLSAFRRRAALQEIYRLLDAPFDFHFDMDTPDSIFCAELLDRVLPELHLPIQRLYGRRVVVPADIPLLATRPGATLAFVHYVRATTTGWEAASRRELAADIEADWRARNLNP